MSFTPPYEIDPSPTGDTVKESVMKLEGNVDDIYGNLNMLQSQISVLPNTGQEILDALSPVDGTDSGLDADYLDGFHASAFSHISHSHPLATASVPGFMPPIDKQKLDGIASGAEVNVNSDWAETSSSEDSYIRNKPQILDVVGTPQSGNIAVFTGPNSIHGSNEQEMQTLLDYFVSGDFISQSAGSADAGKPILTGVDGLIHASMIPAVPAQAIWGGITGTLSNQTDLQAELDLKSNTSHNHDGVYEFSLGNPTTDGYILSSLTDGTRSWIVPPSGGGGDAVWGSITGTLSDQDDLQAALDAKSDDGHTHDDIYFQESEFISVSAGAADVGKPILLSTNGQIDPSMLDVSVFHYIGPFTPVAGTEYPDPTGEDFGAFWVVQGVDDTNGYTFAGGDLSGLTVNNGDFMVWAAAGWSIMAGEMNPTLYYKLDGTQALTDPFAGGAQQIKNIADGTDNTDAVTVLQLAGKANVDHDHIEADISDLDKYTQAEVDGLVGAKENALGNPTTNGYVLSSQTDGTRAWVPPSTGGGDAVWGSIIGTLTDQIDLRDALNLKLDTSAKAADSELLDGLEATAFELALGNPTVDNQILVSLTDGTRGWTTLPVTQWGGIEGTLANQTDLQTALDGKSDDGHNHDADYLAIDGKAADTFLINGQPRVQFVSADPPDNGQGVDGDLWLQT